MKIAIVQMESKIGKIQDNIDKIRDYVFKNRDADFVLFPELAVTGYCSGEFDKYAQEIDGNTSDELSKIARDNSVFIGCGFLEKQNKKQYNSYLVFNKAGNLAAKYRKTHLISEFDKGLTRGNEVIVFETCFGKLSIAICYDLRFPEFWRALMKNGTDAVFLPAQWPENRIEHWNILLRARAIENQFFVVGVNGIGNFSGGRSQAVNPKGEMIGILDDTDEHVLNVEIDLKQVKHTREAFPCLSDICEDV